MILTTFDIPVVLETTSPEPEGWRPYWHGYYQMLKVRSEDKVKRNVEEHAPEEPGVLTERKVEVQVFLNLVHDIDKDHIDMFELGAGRGDWCLSLAGVIDHKIIPRRATTYRCLALEGEPTHYQWTREHFEAQKINGVAVWGASNGYDGSCRFKAIKAPDESYGQGVDEDGNIDVPCYTLPTLAKKHDFSHIDLVHMDVQGVELNVLKQAEPLLAKGLVDYFLIGTHHGPQMNKAITDLLSPYYEVVFSVDPHSEMVDTFFGRAYFPKDGILAFKRK